MKTLTKILIISILTLTTIGCSIKRPTTTVITNNTQLHNLLRNDFDFRYNFSQFNQTQPISWHYSNRFFGSTNFNGYFSYNNRHQMWNDWVWGYPFNNGIGFTYNWRNRRWSSNSYRYWYRYNPYFQPRRVRVNPPRRTYNTTPSTTPRGRSTRNNTTNRRVIKRTNPKVTKPQRTRTTIPRGRSTRNNTTNRRVIKRTNPKVTKPQRTRTTTPPVRSTRKTTKRVKRKVNN